MEARNDSGEAKARRRGRLATSTSRVLAALGFTEQVGKTDSNQVIEMLERGEITPEEAEKLLRGEVQK